MGLQAGGYALWYIMYPPILQHGGLCNIKEIINHLLQKFMLLKKLLGSYKLLIVSIVFIGCNDTLNKNVFIESFYVVNYIYSLEDRGKMLTFKGDRFIIHEFKRNKLMKAYVDSFVANNKGINPRSYSQYSMIFYKYSSITNNEHIKNNPRDLDRYSQENDMVYGYFFNGDTLHIQEYKNGKLIDPE